MNSLSAGHSDLSGLVIAIDGHSSCGKSTLAKQLARKLGYVFVDTGAMYRAVTLYFLRHHIDPDNIQEVSKALADIDISFRNEGGRNITYLNGENVESEIRSIAVSGQVSQVAAVSLVRRSMVAKQQAMDHVQGLVMDGRDIGTVVFPQADLKFFITADVEERAKRRYNELRQQGKEVTLDEIAENLQWRDKIDSERDDSPLRAAADAVHIDNTHLTIEQQFDIVWDMVLAAIAARNS